MNIAIYNPHFGRNCGILTLARHNVNFAKKCWWKWNYKLYSSAPGWIALQAILSHVFIDDISTLWMLPYFFNILITKAQLWKYINRFRTILNLKSCKQFLIWLFRFEYIRLFEKKLQFSSNIFFFSVANISLLKHKIVSPNLGASLHAINPILVVFMLSTRF